MVLKGTRVSIGPDWQKVAGDLRAKIASGEYPLESKIPSTAKLQAAYSASSTVVRQAVRELQHEGVLTGRPGKGVFVVATPAGASAGQASTQTLAKELSEVREDVRDLQVKVADLWANFYGEDMDGQREERSDEQAG